MSATRNIVASLLAASLVSACVFALSWLRVNDLTASLGTVLKAFMLGGILICVLAFTVGFPVAYLAAKFYAFRWWVSTAAAAFVGASLAWVLANNHEGNPFALSFSPWSRDHPGMVGDPPFAHGDFVGSVIIGAIVGASFGLAFWVSFSGMLRPNKSPERTRGR